MANTERDAIRRCVLGDVSYSGMKVTNYDPVRRMYNNQATHAPPFIKYEKEAEHHNYTCPEKLAAMVLKNGSSGKEIIDLGCGSGLLGKIYIEQGFIVDGIDISEKMLALAKKKGYRKTMRKNIVTDSLKEIGPYDIAISTGIIGDFVPEIIALPLMIGILKKNSMMGFSAETKHTDIDEVRKMLASNAFVIKEMEIGTGYTNSGFSGKNYDYYFITAERAA